MNSQNPGCCEAVKESVDVSTVFYSFRLEWKIPSETILNDKHVPRKLSAVPKPTLATSTTPYDDLLKAGLAEMDTMPTTTLENSKWFEFKDLKMRPFYLELYCEKCYDGEMPRCKIKLMTKDDHAMKLNYAIVCSRGDRLYHLAGEGGVLMGYKEQEATLDVLRGICREQKCITVACQITAESNVRGSSVVQSEDGIEKTTLECSFRESSRNSHRRSSSPEEAIDRYLVSGTLPSLDVDSARKLLVKASVDGGLAELKALSVEFLMKNLDSENVAGVWALASERRLQALMTECGRYMAAQWEKAAGSSKKSGKVGGSGGENHNQKNFLFSNIYSS